MSDVLFPGDIRFDQRLLKCAGFYEGKIDGLYGPQTRDAELRMAAKTSFIQSQYGSCDPRSERAIGTLLPLMQQKARQLWKLANERGAATNTICVVLSGTRTYAEQDVLFNQSPKVTNARGGQSNHNFGIAIDVGLFQGKHYLTGATAAEEKAYSDLAKIIKANIEGLEWGGDWHSFPDEPHYQLATGMTLKAVRSAFEAGTFKFGAISDAHS